MKIFLLSFRLPSGNAPFARQPKKFLTQLGSTVHAALLFALGAAALLASRTPARAQTNATLTLLQDVKTSSYGPLFGTLLLGSDGNLYGTSPDGGASNAGFVFKLTMSGTLTHLHDFGSTNSAGTNVDGVGPADGLVQGGDGNFYGLTGSGGSDGKGTYFRITPAGGFTVLHGFGGTPLNYIHNDPFGPAYGLIRGANGNFYGISNSGGTSGNGTFFTVTTAGGVTVLHNFTGNSGDTAPTGRLTVGSDGNFYATTSTQAYRIAPTGAVSVFYTFGTNGSPVDTLTQGSDGNFYGTYSTGGSHGCGAVVKLTPSGQLTVVYSFYFGDGYMPEGVLASDGAGNLYGTTYKGGPNNQGTVFRVNQAGELTVLYSFSPSEVGAPQSGVILDSGGNLYGTGFGGNDAIIFKLRVNAIYPPFFLNEHSLSNGAEYLAFNEPSSADTVFGYYSHLTDPHYIYHFDLGYEYVFDANDGKAGVYFYDFASKTFFYTSPSFPFPYLYDFSLKSALYYYPDPNNAGRYNTDGVRYFYDFATGQVITK